ncbi:YwmB family TATA-box binding protein [Romboutsia sp. CE17]|uniref:YwmB family TATA-box binding protein n=1 Tax=Romboutsia sp. CE17 TaxID=2724150 RepID=UPI001442E40D|nr:YwmB family TATA-box binding protein [Romboutsia sp. CE17]QJA09717.1 YwmB family TATA-box binding protein [Romboutsia sp. CE17]
MKNIKYIALFISLVLLGAMSSYAEIKLDNSYNRFLEAFESTQADFKFYNIKANAPIDYDISKDEIKSICLDIINDLGMEESNVKLEDKWNNNEKQIYIQAENDNTSISVIGIKKNSSESYIMVDILDNKVYKNIVDIYAILKNSLDKFSYQAEIYTCIAGEYSKKLQIDKYNDILDEILYNMNAEVIEKVQEENFLSITAYSKVLKENYLECFGNKINLNIGIRYSEDDERTLIYIATPIIKLDY